MGDVVERRLRHYVGLDADKDSILAGALDPGDSYHANDSGKQYYWDGTKWKTGLGYEYVPRSSNTWDKTKADFTTDGTWKVDGLDLSGIVPVGAVAVVLGLFLLDDAANSRFAIRQNDSYNATMLEQYTQVANLPVRTYTTIPIDENRLMDYFGSNLTFTNIDLVVAGWFI